MRRFFASRLLRTGLLFLFLVGAPSVGGAYRCCSTGDHDGGHRTSGAASGIHQVHDAHAAHEMPMPAVAHHAPPAAPAEHHQVPDGAPCTCVGHCCVPPAIARGAAPAPLPDAPQLLAAPVAIHDAGLRLDSRDAHLLPFGNAPPAPLAS